MVTTLHFQFTICYNHENIFADLLFLLSASFLSCTYLFAAWVLLSTLRSFWVPISFLQSTYERAYHPQVITTLCIFKCILDSISKVSNAAITTAWQSSEDPDKQREALEILSNKFCYAHILNFCLQSNKQSSHFNKGAHYTQLFFLYQNTGNSLTAGVSHEASLAVMGTTWQSALSLLSWTGRKFAYSSHPKYMKIKFGIRKKNPLLPQAL